ncbi:MAG: hypothetical protein N2Z23_07530 [Pyrinomonadaceae bacterium]|nr:hypothetical protein [Pyrinomonadaceae bacterium]MCX7640275.1 hypothetical protein [Pyrinomonadaceae bacterium]MDW8305277.1 hypothetical protein [Acidobacteriota bacterium]
MKDWIFALIAVASAIIAFFSFRSYQSSADTLMLVLTIVFVLSLIIFGGIFLAKKFSKKEEIHITQ